MSQIALLLKKVKMAFNNEYYFVNKETDGNTVLLNIVGMMNDGKIPCIGEVRITKMNLEEFQNYEFTCDSSHGITVTGKDTYYVITISLTEVTIDHPWNSRKTVRIDDATSILDGKFYFGLPVIVYMHMVGQLCTII